MKGGKDEEKIMGPLFPRLHVNDTEKGGPRAPPRNKMALYEQLSIPSQRFDSGAPSTLPLPASNSSNLVPSASSSQGVGQERKTLSPFYISPTPTHSIENLRSPSSNGVNLNTTRADFEQEFMTTTNNQTSNGTRRLSSAAECTSFHPNEFSKDSCAKNIGDVDDCRVTTFSHSGPTPCSNKQMKRTNSTDLKSRQYARNEREGNPTARDCSEKPASYLMSRGKIGEPLKQHTGASSNREHGDSPVDDSSRLHDANARVRQEHKAGLLSENTDHIDGITVASVRGVEHGNASRARAESCSEASFGDEHRNPKEAENGSEYREAHGSLQMGDVAGNDDVSETSMVDSISGLDISPDDVVGVIGEKHFWKARRAIISQQRAFAVQVFELHRLIKVQRLIAASPDMLLEDNHFFGDPSLNIFPVNKLPSEVVLKKPPQIVVKQKEVSQQSNQATKGADENTVRKLPLPSRNLPPAPSVGTDYKAGPWCFPTSGNQWLVPVMSPSEGLVYKPYSGPCPPAAGFMAPVYGGCTPLSLPLMAGDFMNAAYGVPALHQQGIGVLHCTPPFGQAHIPQSSAVEVMSSISGARPHGLDDRLSTEKVNFGMYYQTSCNTSSQKNAPISCCIGKLQPSKDSEVQGSTASSPFERMQGEGMGCAPSIQVSDQPTQPHSSDQRTLAIKVVPHNRRSASESAARIFRSIQEERRQ